MGDLSTGATGCHGSCIGRQKIDSADPPQRPGPQPEGGKEDPTGRFRRESPKRPISSDQEGSKGRQGGGGAWSAIPEHTADSTEAHLWAPTPALTQGRLPNSPSPRSSPTQSTVLSHPMLSDSDKMPQSRRPVSIPRPPSTYFSPPEGPCPPLVTAIIEMFGGSPFCQKWSTKRATSRVAYFLHLHNPSAGTQVHGHLLQCPKTTYNHYGILLGGPLGVPGSGTLGLAKSKKSRFQPFRGHAKNISPRTLKKART